jgi:hypothetical protein
VLREILGSKKDGVNIMRNFVVVRQLKSKKLQWAGCAARIMEAVNAYAILWEDVKTKNKVKVKKR